MFRVPDQREGPEQRLAGGVGDTEAPGEPGVWKRLCVREGFLADHSWLTTLGPA